MDSEHKEHKQLVEELYNKGYNAFGRELIVRMQSTHEVAGYTTAGLIHLIQSMLIKEKP